MKIVFFLRDISDCGGIQQTTCNLVNHLLEQDESLEITAISLYHKSNSTFFPLVERVNRIALFNKKVDQRFSFFSIRRKMKKLLTTLSYDVLVIQGILFSIYIPKSAWKKNNIIACEHGHYGMGTNFGFHAMGRNTAIKKAIAIVSLTSADKDIYESHCKKDKIVEAIPNAYLPLDYEPLYSQDSKTIISVGTLDDIKQMNHAIEAARIVFLKHHDWTWLIYGDGPNKNDLQEQINNSGLSNQVFLRGYESNKKIIYGDESFLVLTSKFEGFGMVLVEALQHKLPIVSYNVKYGPKEIVQDGVNGRLVSANNIEELSSTICDLIENKEQRATFSNNSIKTIERFSPQSVVNRWMALFEKIANK